MNEDERWEMDELKRQIANAHDVLDDLGLPRSLGEKSTLTLSGRLSWSRTECSPMYWELAACILKTRDDKFWKGKWS